MSFHAFIIALSARSATAFQLTTFHHAAMYFARAFWYFRY